MKLMRAVLAFWAVTAVSLSAAEKDWQSLFDGKTLTGWTAVDGKPPGAGWKVVDGTIHLDGKGGNLITAEEYSSFELEWSWKIANKANNGIKYWVNDHGNKEWLGIEYQMIDDGVHHDGKIGSNRATASIYGIKAAAADKPLLPAEQWNQSRIVVKDGTIQHYLNGKLVVEADTKTEEWKKQVAASKFGKKQGFAPGRGRIMLTDHNDRTWFKDLRIRRL